ncbi:WSC domain-containing protein, partial [Salmonella enterica]|uniref:WSC domain-containing protein n=1 Tax=Salmonella enterica TaxID=28901 RepID=UPI0020C255DA
ICGTEDRINIYKATKRGQNSVTVGNFNFLQCSADAPNNRVLNGAYTHGDDITINKCADFCSGFTYFGLEYGRECFCGNQFAGT